MKTVNNSKKRILVADGSKIYLKHMTVLLQRLGFGIITAESGIDVLKNLSVIRPDLIMLDMVLPWSQGSGLAC